jgi:nucleolar protein 56
VAMLLFTNWFGAFVWEDGKVVESRLFPKDARELAKRLAAVQDFLALREEEELARGREGLEVPEKRLSRLGNYIRQPVPFLKPEDYGFAPALLREAMLVVARERARVAVGPDVYLKHAVDALDELTRQYNFQLERLREWHGSHFPEFAGLVGDERYVAMLCDGPERERLAKELGLEGESLGADASEEDLAAMAYLAMQARNTLEARSATEDYIRGRARELAPNSSEVVGELLAARMIALAGGMERLARMPSSTVQMLGAEKAFFKHLKSGARPPKHGALFQHPLVHRAPYWQRGKVARALAGKLSIAARVDFYRGKAAGKPAGDLGKGLAEKVEARAKDVARQFPEAPKRLRIIRTEDSGRRDGRGGDRRRDHRRDGHRDDTRDRGHGRRDEWHRPDRGHREGDAGDRREEGRGGARDHHDRGRERHDRGEGERRRDDGGAGRGGGDRHHSERRGDLGRGGWQDRRPERQDGQGERGGPRGGRRDAEGSHAGGERPRGGQSDSRGGSGNRWHGDRGGSRGGRGGGDRRYDGRGSSSGGRGGGDHRYYGRKGGGASRDHRGGDRGPGHHDRKFTVWGEGAPRGDGRERKWKRRR